MSRRPLGDMLAEVGMGVVPADAWALRVHRVSVTLPVELALQRQGGVIRLLGELPRGRWRTDFDLQPGRLELVLEACDER
jgi:hypothetical protein